jgi:hypothetical protein
VREQERDGREHGWGGQGAARLEHSPVLLPALVLLAGALRHDRAAGVGLLGVRSQRGDERLLGQVDLAVAHHRLEVDRILRALEEERLATGRVLTAAAVDAVAMLRIPPPLLNGHIVRHERPERAALAGLGEDEGLHVLPDDVELELGRADEEARQLAALVEQYARGHAVRLVQRVRQAATAEALHEQQRVEVVLVVALGGVLAARAAAEQLLQLLRRGAASERLPEQLVEARHLVVGQQLEDALCPVAELARDLGRFG